MSKFQWSIIIFILVEGGIYFQFQGSDFYYPLLLAGFILYLSLIFAFSMNLPLRFFVNASVNSEKGSVALGFDDGPHPENTLKILNILDKYNAKAAFFLIGKQAEDNQEIVKEMFRRGHKIGGHSYSHPINFGFLSYKNVAVEIMDGIKIVEEITQSEIALFRPPFGVTNPRIAKVINKNNLEVIAWNLRSYDTVSKDPDSLLKTLKKKVKSGSSILLHDSVPATLEILPELLEYIRDKNLQIRPSFE